MVLPWTGFVRKVLAAVQSGPVSGAGPISRSSSFAVLLGGNVEVNVFGSTCGELADEMKRRYGKGSYHAKILYRGIFKQGAASLAEVRSAGFPGSTAFAERLRADVRFPSCRIVDSREDEAIKYGVALADGRCIEFVIIPSRNRATLCVSSQVGCRMGCKFCATGRMGFVRNLAVEEIVWQVHAARFALGRRVDNIVFMGMGEPLDNFANVTQAVRVMNDQHGLDIALRRVTVSTAGHADGIRNLAAANLPNLRLAVSLNAAEDRLRSSLMPINRAYPLARLKEELLAFPLGRDSVIFVEYVLLAGINDSIESARRLASYLEGLSTRVNVIAYNPGGAQAYTAPPPEQVERFRGWLASRKIFVRVRRPHGRSVMAACGQLGASLPRCPLAGQELTAKVAEKDGT